jgi:hypothetical protein
LDGGGLVRRSRGNERETTSRSVVGLIVADGFFVTTRGTALSTASRRSVREVGNSRSLVDLCSSDGGDERRSSRVRRVQVVFRAIRVSTSVGSRVTRGGDEGNSTESNLLELNVDTGDVTLGVNSELLAFLATNSVFTLIFFVPSVRDRVYKRNVLGSEHVNSKSIQPNVVGFNPEPTSSLNSDSENPLDIEVSLNLRIVRVVLSNDVVSGNRRDGNSKLSGERSKVARREVLVNEFNYSSG